MENIGYKSQREKIHNFNNGFLAAHLINIGAKLGLFKTLYDAKEGVTISDLALKLGLHEPYLKIWCQTAYFFEILDCDIQGRFKFQPFFDEILGDESHIRNVLGSFKSLVNTSGERLKIASDSFKTGKIIESYSAERSKIAAEATSKIHQNIGIFFSMLPREIRIKKKLKNGIRFLDIGCGSGGLIINLAQKYKNTRFVGIDPIPYGIEGARERILQLELEEQVSVDRLGGENLTYIDEFDIISMILTFHEILPNVRRKALEKSYQALKNDGYILIIDFSYPDKLTDFKDPKYELGILDQFREACAGVIQLSEQEQNELLTKVGFKNIQRTSFQGLDLITATK